MIEFLITALVTAVSLFLISKLPIGVDVDNFQIAAIAGIVFGLLNAFVSPVIRAVLTIPDALTLGLFHGLITLIANSILFGLAAWLVGGFRLSKGWLSAILGALALTFVNSVLFKVLGLITG
ncbi:MAG: phage holin family protein [Geitlerinemataceae cyanobacterium]